MRTITEYKNRYAGRRFVIVGKGQTRYNYRDLIDVADPVIFINDAVQFAPLAAHSIERFFFALDERQACWLGEHPDVTPVLPREADDAELEVVRDHQERLFVATCEAAQQHPKTVTFEWGGRHLQVQTYNREALAMDGRLALRGGSIHPAIHFAWLCGCSEIAFIGCAGDKGGYDPRIEIKSGTPDLRQRDKIRKRQDLLMDDLEVDATYVQHTLEPIISRIANFVWLGPKPDWLAHILLAFRAHNPKWYVRLIDEVPDMSGPLRHAVRGCKQVCQIADIIYCWMLWQDGGIVMDTDSVTLRSFEPLRTRGPAWTTQHNDRGTRPTNGVMGSVPRSEAFARCNDYIEDHAVAVEQGLKQWRRCQYGPDMLREVFTDQGDQDMRILPWHYFYPWSFQERDQAAAFWKNGDGSALDAIQDRFVDGERPFAVHFWGIDGSSKRETTKEYLNVG